MVSYVSIQSSKPTIPYFKNGAIIIGLFRFDDKITLSLRGSRVKIKGL
jgi:hypothetical protein